MAFIRIRICDGCGKIEEVRKDNKAKICKICSSKKSLKKAVKRKKELANEKKCIACNIKFKAPLSSNKKYCSIECKNLSISEQKKCNYCGDKFRYLKCKSKSNSSGNYCKRECYNNHLKTIVGENHRDYKRVDKMCAYCKEKIKIIPARADKNNCCSIECKIELHRGMFAGDKNGNWRGGHKKRKGNFEQVKNKHFKGIKFCSLCGTSKKIDIHHVVPFRYTEDNSLKNLIPLCRSCHRKVEIITWQLIDTGIEHSALKILMNSILRQMQAINYTKLRKLKNER